MKDEGGVGNRSVTKGLVHPSSFILHPSSFLDQGLQQELELAQLNFTIEGVVGPVDDGDRKRAVVAMPLEHRDDPGVFDLSLTDADLKLAWRQARITQMDILHLW